MSKSTLYEKNIDWQKQLTQIASKFSCDSEIMEIVAPPISVGYPKLSIGVIGGPNAGQRSVINCLLGRDIVPAKIINEFPKLNFITLADENIENIEIVNGEKINSIDNLESFLKSSDLNKTLSIKIDNTWLKKQDIFLVLENSLDFSENELPLFLKKINQDLDAFIFAVNALSPLRRSDICFLKQCIEKKQPVSVVICNLDMLDSEDKAEVVEHVRNELKKLDESISVAKLSSSLTKNIESYLNNIEVTELRNYKQAFRLIETCDFLIIKAKNEIEKHEELNKETKNKIDNLNSLLKTQELNFDRIELDFNKRRQNIEKRLRDFLKEHHNSILTNLEYSLQKSQNIMTWWEEDLPHQLNIELIKLSSDLDKLINMHIDKDIEWLQNELEKRFNYRHTNIQAPVISSHKEKTKFPDMELTDSHKYRIYARVGYAATILGAGTLLAAASGGIAIAAGVTVGIISEQYHKLKNDKDRKRVRHELNIILFSVEQDFINAVLGSLKPEYLKVFNNISSRVNGWKQSQQNSINTMKDEMNNNEMNILNESLKELHQVHSEINSTLGSTK